ncbi:MAG: helix-turn-helix transcriptional regulator [Bacteroidaceae bacterium]|nr:helix-turn-helix transcriptional regulator [Bacteroidaceae bacterium]
MMTIGEMQFGGMLVMAMLALMLVVCVPQRANYHAGFALARWLMVGGTSLIALQFLLQHQLGLRQMGVTQGVLLNLLLFMPASLLVSVAVLSVQRQGRVNRNDWLFGTIVFCVATLLLGMAVLTDGVPISQESTVLRYAEYVGALLYTVMQCWFFHRHYREYRRMKRAVDEYFDRDREDLLAWMGLSIKLLAILALFVPLAIFLEGVPLMVFGVVFFFSIAYCVVSFYSYGISEDSARVEKAEESEEGIDDADATTDDVATAGALDADATEDDMPLSDEQQQRISEAVERWKQSGAYRQHDLTLDVVAHQMLLPTKQLRLWFRHSEYKKLAGFVNVLRIEEAKRVLLEHPEWDVEVVAEQCGFNHREYFHRIFRQQLGMTPFQYQKQYANTKSIR